MQKLILWGFVGILVLGLGVVFAIPSGRTILGSFAPINESTVVAYVGNYPITVSELKAQIRAMAQSQASSNAQRPQDTPDAQFLYPQYGSRALDTIIDSRVVRLEADRLGLGVSEAELRDRITSMFKRPDGQWMGAEEYMRRIRSAGMSVEAFERDMADQLIEEKLRNVVISSLMVSDKEIEDDYKRSNTSMEPTYVLVTPKPEAVPAASEEDLRAYFDANREKFKITSPQRKITYIFISQEAVGKALQVSDDDLRRDYDADPKKFVSAVHVAQIVFNIPSNDQDSAVRTKAQGIADRARGGGENKAEDFAELAKANSEDAATAANGGDAGMLEKAQVKAGDPRERLFTFDEGQVTAPIKVGNSYVVYKVLDRRQKTFEEAREELMATARTRQAYSKGVELSRSAEQKLKDTKDANRVAQEINASVNAPADAPVAIVRETPFVQPGDQLPDIGVNAQFDESTSKLKEKGDVGATVGVTGGFAVPMLAETREPHDATFDEVRDKIGGTYREDKAREIARNTAQQLANEATSPEDLRTRAKAVGFDAKTQENFKAGSALPEMQPSDLLDSALLAIPANSVSKAPVDMPNGIVVLAVGKRTEADMGDAFNQQRDSIRQRLLSSKQASLYAEYIKSVRKQLEESGKIVIYQDTIDDAMDVGGLGDDNFGDEGMPQQSVPTLPPVGSPQAPPGPGAGGGVPGMPTQPVAPAPQGAPKPGPKPGAPQGAPPVPPGKK